MRIVAQRFVVEVEPHEVETIRDAIDMALDALEERTGEVTKELQAAKIEIRDAMYSDRGTKLRRHRDSATLHLGRGALEYLQMACDMLADWSAEDDVDEALKDQGVMAHAFDLEIGRLLTQ